MNLWMFPKTLKLFNYVLNWNTIKEVYIVFGNFLISYQAIFFFSIFSCFTKSGDQPQEGLTKFSYKTNKEVENLGILFHVDKPLEPISLA
jgi:hypothetical protein